MEPGAAGFDDVTFDLISVEYHARRSGHALRAYVRDAEQAGEQNVADFFRGLMDEDLDRAQRCHELLRTRRPRHLHAEPAWRDEAVPGDP